MLTDEQITEHYSHRACLNTNQLNINILQLGVYALLLCVNYTPLQPETIVNARPG